MLERLIDKTCDILRETRNDNKEILEYVKFHTHAHTHAHMKSGQEKEVRMHRGEGEVFHCEVNNSCFLVLAVFLLCKSQMLG